MSSYKLSKQWFDFAFENPDKINVNQTALYFWLIQLNNQKDWAEKFPFNTEDAGEATGMKNRKTIWKTLNELVSFGFVAIVLKSMHRHKPTIISLPVLNSKEQKNTEDSENYQSIKRTSKETVNIITDPTNGQVNIITDPKNGQVKLFTDPLTSPSNGQVDGQVNGFTVPVLVHQTDTLINIQTLSDNVIKPKQTLNKKEKNASLISVSENSDSNFENENSETGNETSDLIAKNEKNSTQGGAVTQVQTPEEINSRITFDVKALEDELKETIEEQAKDRIRAKIIALKAKYIVQLPYDSEEFALAWAEWISYKKKNRNMYGTIRGQQKALHELVEAADKLEETAIEIIQQSMDQGWKGFFPLKKKISTNLNGDFNERLKAGMESSYDRSRESIERIQALAEKFRSE